jgi:hypothetical protein
MRYYSCRDQTGPDAQEPDEDTGQYPDTGAQRRDHGIFQHASPANATNPAAIGRVPLAGPTNLGHEGIIACLGVVLK